MGIKKKAVDLLGDVIDTTKKQVKKEVKKASKKPGKQDDLFPETIPSTPEATKAADKLSAAERKKFKKAQTDMFPDELNEANYAKKVLNDYIRDEQKKHRIKVNKNAMKPKKKAAGGPIKKFGAGKEVVKTFTRFGKAAKELAAKKAAAAAAAAKKKSGELLEKSAEKTVDMPKNIRSKITTAKDIAAGKKVAQARHAKLATSGKMTPSQRKKVLKRQAQSGYAHGGPVRKSIDGIAQRGLTRAKHK